MTWGGNGTCGLFSEVPAVQRGEEGIGGGGRLCGHLPGLITCESGVESEPNDCGCG